ncbi:TlpA disulfide reductase family protein [Shewanella sp. YLB-07]|uniref:TlpA disulfide reductase family protein n=1 Tax=Shewanella sp. YLB-07 TaxID=2601268 RepID=UPI00128E2EFF|nr:TlpA disulfide reductase family protein [Shewanella sp. YLB-07]MPY26886.1 TlpA family protein disulfide reductase [Shewanella sp. YLB-07]
MNKGLTKVLTVSLLALTSLSIGAAMAYPGMHKKDEGVAQSSIDLISVLPETYPIDVVPFSDGNGKPVDFSQYRGKVIMVNMWATWCPPCVRELPAIERLSSKFDKAKFEVLPISIDLDGKEKVEPFLKELGMEGFTSYYDEKQQLGQVFPLDTIPATFILNEEGELIAFVRTFVDWDDEKAVELIQSFIDKPI